MKKLFTLIALSFALFVFTNAANAQSKIGYISTQDLIGVMPETVKADSNLRQFQAALVTSAREKEESLNNAIEKFNKDSATFTAAVKEVKRADLQKAYQELTGEDQRIQSLLEQKRNELVAPIQRKALETIQTVAKESGYTHVFERDALLVAPPGDDILPLVAKKMNIKLPPASGPAAAPKTGGRQ
ncbi:MAG TPA: OmpH family outer membrane protein [Flavitalea sp.]|nr:OmpH family outer membrane protein [Flavitalea sp.]